MGDITFTAQTNFESNMRLELQQKESKLAPKAIQRNVAGAEKTKVDNLIANQKMRKKTERNGDVTHDTTGWDGIWVAKPDPSYLATLVDTEDKLMTSVDIQGGEVMTHSAAVRRAKDDDFLAGFYGDMITGKQGTVLNAFPAANVVPVDFQGPSVATANDGLNVAKIRRARRILARNFVDQRRLPQRAQAEVVGGRQVPDRPRRLRVRGDRARQSAVRQCRAHARRQRLPQGAVLVGRRHGASDLGGAVYVGRSAADEALLGTGLFALPAGVLPYRQQSVRLRSLRRELSPGGRVSRSGNRAAR
jgi:hypothetical protein